MSVADSEAITRNSIPAFWEDPNWVITWKHTTLEAHLIECLKRSPRNLITDRAHKRHQKAVDSEGRLIGYARWLLPDSHAKFEVWSEAVVPLVGAEEEEEMKRIAATAIWKPNDESDDLLVPLQEARKELLKGKEYMFLDYLAVHPENKGKGTATALVESGMQAAEDLGLDIFITAFKAGVGLYKRLGFRILKDFVQDDSKYGGTGKAYFALMIYEQKR
ncbi:hypothetical protein ACEPPN_001615 [Leptodophora sp. 'Broadleaf-Isolate-01']